MTNESAVKVTVTPRGEELAVVLDFQDPNLDQERLEKNTLSIASQIRDGFEGIKIERLSASPQDLSEGIPKSGEDSPPQPGVLGLILNIPTELKSLLSWIAKKLGEGQTYVVEVQDEDFGYRQEIKNFRPEDVEVLSQTTTDAIEKLIQARNK